MTRALIRFARRRANWEEPLPVDELQKREFKARDGGPDLRPSLYELNDPGVELVRAYAEHAYRIEPVREALALDVGSATPEVVATPGEGPFSFARERHREVPLGDEGELRQLIGKIATGAARSVVSRVAVQTYVCGRLGARDPEWRSAAAERGAHKWLRRLAAAVDLELGKGSA